MTNHLTRLFLYRLCSLVFALLVTANTVKAVPSSEQFMNTLGTCAANMNLKISADILGSIKKIYEGKGGVEGKEGVEGEVSIKNAPEFLILFPENERKNAYDIYVKCVIQILGENSKTPLSNEKAQQCTITLAVCKQEYKKDYKSSILHCEKYLECDPDNPGVFAILGKAYGKLGHIGKSDEYFNKQLKFATEFDDNYVKANSYYNLAVNTLMKGAPDKAKNLVEKSININRGTNQIGLAANYKLLGDIYYKKSDFYNAITNFDRSIRICSTIDHKKCLAAAYIGYGFTKLRLKDPTNGCSYLKRAREIFLTVDSPKDIQKINRYLRKSRCG